MPISPGGTATPPSPIAACRRRRTLRPRLEEAGWDGAWYRRAYFDDGSPLGSSSNPECQIDSIAQSWAVLSGAADPARARAAMDAVDARLVRRDDGLVRLLDPPFDTSALDPGYIKGYVPGVRENGGQYTHAAIWAAMAFAELGDARRAWEVWRLINPLAHGASPAAIETYKVEPYVVAADVYAVAPHVGRGGWTWYTGSAAWMYRLVVESLLGLRLEGDRLRIEPCLPADWTGFTVHYRYRETVYHIAVHQTPHATGDERLSLDGHDQAGLAIPLVDDHLEHRVEVWVRAAGRSPVCGEARSSRRARLLAHEGEPLGFGVRQRRAKRLLKACLDDGQCVIAGIRAEEGQHAIETESIDEERDERPRLPVAQHAVGNGPEA